MIRQPGRELFICPKCHCMSLLAPHEEHVCLEGDGKKLRDLWEIAQ